MSIYKPKGSPFWHYDFQKNGQRFSGSARTADKSLALKIEKEEKKKAEQLTTSEPCPRMTLDVAIGEYWERHAQHRKSSRDIEIKLERLVKRLGPDTIVSELANKDIADYVLKRRSEVKNASVNSDLRLLRAAFFYVRDNLDIEIPKIKWKTHFLDEPRGRTRYLTDDEQKKLLKTIRADYLPFIKFCLLTGCRVSSARKLKWKDVNNDTLRLYVKSKITGDYHDLPVTDDVQAILDSVKGNHPEYVFTYLCERNRAKRGNKVEAREKGKHYPLTETNWKREWWRALEACEIEDFRFHDLRHTAATRILKESENIAVVGAVLGHKDLKSTMRYAHVLPEDVRKALTSKPRKNPRRKNKTKEKQSAKVG